MENTFNIHVKPDGCLSMALEKWYYGDEDVLHHLNVTMKKGKITAYIDGLKQRDEEEEKP